MQYDKLLVEDKRKLLNLVKHEYINLDFSKLTTILDNNYTEPLWMDVSILLYGLNIINPDITVFDILLHKLSKQFARLYFKDGDKRFIATSNELIFREYLWYQISKEPVQYFINAQYIPARDFIKQILNLDRFDAMGIYVEHVTEDKFRLAPIGEEFSNIDEAEILYNRLIEIQDLKNSLNITNDNLLANFKVAESLSKDKRMIATLSNLLSSFRVSYEIKEDYLTIPGTDFVVQDESSAMSCQAKIIDAYHFFRNVINTDNKKDIVSEIYNKKVAPEIKEQFEENYTDYLKVIKNQDLIDWIVTISKESKYTLKINNDSTIHIKNTLLIIVNL